MSLYVIIAAAGYLLGSIPFGYLLVRIFRGQDIREMGSGNIGATNVARSGARGLGLLTLLLDAGKGFAAVMAAMLLTPAVQHWGQAGPSSSPSPVPLAMYGYAAVAAIFAIMGHIFPVWLRFRGGKGVATAVGAFAALAPKALLIALLIFLVILLAFGYVSLGSILATAAFPALVYLLNGSRVSPLVLTAMCAAAALIIARHHSNIRRLLAGTEHRFRLKRH